MKHELDLGTRDYDLRGTLRLSVAAMTIVALSSCVSVTKCEPADGLHGVTYCTGKIAGDGQEGIFRDAWITHEGKSMPVLQSFHGGASLWGQTLQGVGAGAMISGGMAGGAALLRPTRITEQNALSNEQSQSQRQRQGQEQSSYTSSNADADATIKREREHGKPSHHYGR